MAEKDFKFDTAKPEILVAAILTNAARTLKLSAHLQKQTLGDDVVFGQVGQTWLHFVELVSGQ